MTGEDAKRRLRELQNSGDTEGAHVEADDILCDLLKAIGYDDVIAEYHKVGKWYA